MHTYEEYRQILELWEDGFKKKRIAIMTGINRATVYECIVRYQSVEGLEAFRIKHPDIPVILTKLMTMPDQEETPLFKAYAYLLGLYLGDGYVAKSRNTYRLRIACDAKYPEIIASCTEAISRVLPNNKVDTVNQKDTCIVVSCYNNHWPELFPQHGDGPKHSRQIVLEKWQDAIVQAYPLSLFKGLYHSDGCRSRNVVNGKNYPKYEFSNKSDDIRALFCRTCDQLDLHWRTASGGRNIQIARRPDVEYLDQHIGPKT